VPRTLLEPPVERLTVLYDDDCGFCRWSAGQLRALDRHRRLELVPLQHATDHPDRPDLARLARSHDLAGAIHVLRPDGETRAGGGAMLEIIDALPGGWLLRPWALLPGIEAVVDFGYRLVADRRSHVSAWLGRTGTEVLACDLDRQPAAAGGG
jgi:predicted DCC family thiol-disulfide oxidoreductase YuxK